MTDVLKNALNVLLEKYKEEKVTTEEFAIILEGLLDVKTNTTYYPITFPNPFPDYPWDRKIWYDEMWKPYCGDGDVRYTTTTTNTLKDNKNE